MHIHVKRTILFIASVLVSCDSQTESGKAYRPVRNPPHVEAAEKGDVGTLREYLESRENDPAELSRLLDLAASSGRTEAAGLLLDYGADIGGGTCTFHPPLISAAMNGHVGTMELLLSRGADVQARDTTHRTALHWAVEANYLRRGLGAVYFLVDNGADVDARDSEGKTPLDYAKTWTLDPEDPVLLKLASKSRIGSGRLPANATTPSKNYVETAGPIHAEATEAVRVPGIDASLEMIRECGGNFLMGPGDGERGRQARESPQHPVVVSPFWLGKYEVTVAQFRAFVDGTGYVTEAEIGDWTNTNWRSLGFDQEEDHPVVNITWNDVKQFIEWLNARTSGGFRLPTEAEWEYACRAGTTTPFFFGDRFDDIMAYAWFGGNVIERGTRPVGQKHPNPLGLHDILGNVGEWCEDDFHFNYQEAPSDGSAWISAPRLKERVIRGDSWEGDIWWSFRSSSRTGYPYCRSTHDIGFRLARDIQD